MAGGARSTSPRSRSSGAAWTSECRAVSGEKSYRLAAAAHVQIGERRRGRGNRPLVKNKYAIRRPNGKQRANTAHPPPGIQVPDGTVETRLTNVRHAGPWRPPPLRSGWGKVPSGSVSRFFGCRLSPEIPPLTAASHGPRPASACDTASRPCALSIAGPSPYNCAALRPGFAFGRKRVVRQPRPPRGHQRHMRLNAPAMGSQWKRC